MTATCTVCGQGPFWGLMISLVVGMVRMVMDFALPAPYCSVPEIH